MAWMLRYACIATLAVAGIVGGQNPPDRARLLQQLQSSDPPKRAAAFEQLGRERGVFAAPGMSDVLVSALDRENHLVRSALQESGGASGVSQKYGEGFAEYTAILLQTCLRYCDLGKPATIKVLMTGPYYGEGEFAERVAPDHGAEILPQMLAEARGAPYGRQIEAVSMLGSIGRLSRTLSPAQRRSIDSALVAAARLPSDIVPPFALHAMATVLQSARVTPDERTEFHRAIAGAARSTDPRIRPSAVEKLTQVGDSSDLSLLRELSSNDSTTSTNHGHVTFRVREEAKRAIARISRP